MVVRRLRWKSDSAGYLGNYSSQIATVAFDPDRQAAPVLRTRVQPDLSAPVWSPDGRRLATTGNLHPDGEAVRKSYIYLVDVHAPPPATANDSPPRELFGLEEMRSTDLAWSPDGRSLAVCGHDDPVIGHYGNQMLWLVDTATGDGACITRGLDRALGDYSRNADMRRYGGDDGPRWAPDGESLLVLVNEAGSVDLYRIDRATGAATPLTQGKHSVVAFSVVYAQTTGAPTTVLLIGDDMNPGDLFVLEESGALRRLTDVNGALLAELALTAPIRFQALSDGLTLDCWMMPPVDRRPGQRYPLILYTGGGPGGMRASVFCHEFHLYAAHGYCVVHCNTRGNHGYGEAFSLATRGQWGVLDYDDNMACLAAACEQFDFVDPTRLAVAGGSYGGLMATWIISRHPEFKAAVVDRCLYNRYSFNGTGDIGFLLDRVEFDKRYPWEAVGVYIERSPMTYIGGVRTPTLVVHSELDHRCPVEQGEQLYMALKRLGVPTELVRFPNESHELSRNGRPWHRVFRLDRYLDWFARWL
jgi:dipeptidyl aminopeptidase/acylaminoacyl peptidase